MARSEEEIKNLNVAAQEFINSVASMASNLKELSRGIEQETGETSAKSIVQRREFLDLADKLSKYSKEDLADKRKANSFNNTFNKAKSKQVGLEAEIAALIKKGGKDLSNLSKSEIKRLETLVNAEQQYKGIVGRAEDLQKTLKEIDKDTKLFNDIKDIVDEIPVIRKVFDEFKKGYDASRKASAEQRNATKAFFGELVKGGSKLAGIFAVGSISKGLTLANEQFTELSRNINISRKSAVQLQNSFKDVGSFGGQLFTAQDMIEGLNAVNAELGSAGIISAETAETMALMTTRLGLSNSQAAKLNNFAAATGQSTKDAAEQITQQVLVLNDANDSAVSYQQVMADIAGASAAVQLSTEKFPGGIAQAAFNARKFGMTLAQLDNIAGSLLNFEESIGAELEAELLLGKELNLEKARMFALTNDLTGLQNELEKQGITALKFQQMNRIEQEAAAKALGMSRDDMAETLVKQEALKKVAQEFGIQGINNLSVEERVTALMQKKNKATNENYTRAEALRALGEDELARQAKNLSVQESIDTAVTSIAESLSGFGDIMNPIASFFKGVATSAGKILTILTAISLLRFRGVTGMLGGLRSLGKGGGIGKGVDKLGRSFKYDKTTGQRVAKSTSLGGGGGIGKFGKGLGKGLLRKAGPLALLFGAYDAFSGFNADANATFGQKLKNAGLSALSGLTFGLAGKSASDIKSEAMAEPQLAKGGIVKQPTRALVGEAGPEAVVPLTQFYKKMDEMIDAINQSKDVYFDTNKVSMALGMGEYRTRTG